MPGGVKEYSSSGVDPAIPEKAYACPFCPTPHRLRRHWFYRRLAVDQSGAHIVQIRRLLCPKTGKTVSLLPDFLVPHKQYTSSILATFLSLFAWMGLSLASAISQATGRSSSWQLAGAWCRSVLNRRNKIRKYVAALAKGPSSTPIPPPSKDSALRQSLRSLLSPLRAGFETFPPAFVEHSRRMHERYRVALC